MLCQRQTERRTGERRRKRHRRHDEGGSSRFSSGRRQTTRARRPERRSRGGVQIGTTAAAPIAAGMESATSWCRPADGMKTSALGTDTTGGDILAVVQLGRERSGPRPRLENPGPRRCSGWDGRRCPARMEFQATIRRPADGMKDRRARNWSGWRRHPGRRPVGTGKKRAAPRLENPGAVPSSGMEWMTPP